MLKDLKEFKLPEIEEAVLKSWKQHSIFEQSLKKNEGKNKFVFFEGPPTANGMPGIHHQLGRAFKDIIPRFKAMQGFDVPRKAGWDTHGLPVEIQAEKELGFKGKQDIEKYGIAAFNKKCKELVWKYRSQFEHATERLGFWLDLKHPYVTYENSYIESLWWIINKIDKKKLLYQGHKVVPWCTRCGTALSSHELAQGYKEVEDTSVYVKFKVKKGQKIGKNFIADNKTYILSWTTTPWTLPGNVALAVGDKIGYSVIQVNEEIYILATERLPVLFPDSSKFLVLSSLPGKDLVGLIYEPLFAVKKLQTKKAHKVYAADFVTTTDGTGVVHTAVMYGEDDYALGTKVGLPQHHTVDERGHFTEEVKGLAGMYAKGGKTETAIIEHLTANNLLLKSEKYKHEYPHCWRCGTPLLYYARSSWFVAMSKLRGKLLAGNKTINWIPAHTKEGRFGEWLREVKDWNFSRERYWGTPLPVWRSRDHKTQLVVSSLADIKKYGNLQGNRFFGMRHGTAVHNFKHKLAGGPESKGLMSELTPAGVDEVHAAIKQLKKLKIDVIVASPYYRTQQTAQIVAKALKKKVTTEKRLGEMDFGVFNWQAQEAFHRFFIDKMARWSTPPEKGETLTEVRRRTVEAVRAINRKYTNKNILIIGHGDPLWLLEGALRGQKDEEFFTRPFYPKKAHPFEMDPPVLPFDEDGRLDLHRPYIDSVVLRDPKTKKELHRVKEVVDVWFDSGSMPYAQNHYPFDFAQGKPLAGQKLDYPADYICEGQDQTRGWFYTLLAIATTLGMPAPFKNVICTGLIHDKNGQKMSKSKGNIVDPVMIMDKYGADALRWYFYTINDPSDAKNFDEGDLGKLTRRFILILYNSFLFWNSYASSGGRTPVRKPAHVLDQWILARLSEVTTEVTRLLEAYDVVKAALTLESFTDDLSRWYIRRSRDRFQSGARGALENEGDFLQASSTLYQALHQLSILLAPFTPFLADALYRSLGAEKASVHLEDWPIADAAQIDSELLKGMAAVRTAAAGALALRAEAKIKVRQPLAKLTLKDKTLQGKTELLKILMDEVNVKSIAFDAALSASTGLALDTAITRELKEEGAMRELTRAVQGLRADAGFSVSDEITLYLEGPEQLMDVVQRYSVTFKRAVGAKTIEFKRSEKATAHADLAIDEWQGWIGVQKI